MTRPQSVASYGIGRRCRVAVVVGAHLGLMACGTDLTGPTRVETFSGVFTPTYTGSMERFDLHEGHVDATLTWTVPAHGTRPTAQLVLFEIDIPGDNAVAASPTTAVPPITLSGSGASFGRYITVYCHNCKRDDPDYKPVPFTLSLAYTGK